MASRAVRRSRPERPAVALRLAPILFAALIMLLALLGGSSRYDVGALFVLRPLLVLIAAAMLLLPTGELAPTTRVPGLLLGLLALVILLQLVPLPPAMWMRLPERAGYAQVAIWIDQPQPRRPITLVPTLTLNSLLALLPAAAALIAASRLDRRDLPFVTLTLLICGVSSALLGVVQIGSASTSWAYLYGPYSEGVPMGVFANRNHQGAFLAGLLPILAAWASVGEGRVPPIARRWAAGLGATLFVLTVLITGSRTGLLFAALDLVGAGWIFIATYAGRHRGKRILSVAGVVGLVVVLALLIGTAVLLGRGGGITRLAALDTGAEMRVQALPVLRTLMLDYLPWGSGFGTFDPLFRIYEPDSLLNPLYFNNAHNDLLELAITGGVPALLLLLALLGWLGWRIMAIVRIWRGRGGGERPPALPLAAAMMAITWLLASLSDYPLRTPLAGAVFAFACCLLSSSATGVRRSGL